MHTRHRRCWFAVLLAPVILAYMLTPLLLDPLLYLVFLIAGSCGLVAVVFLLGLVIEPLSRYLNCCDWRFAGFPILFAFATPIAFGLNTIVVLLVLGLLFACAVVVSRYCCCRDIFSALMHVAIVWSIWGVIAVVALVLRGVL
ncbi:MAG TPA: hypothetical protein EYH59_05285 [Pyrodictium sp.]|nr:hypothetical protein [Pyrodictium sp.]